MPGHRPLARLASASRVSSGKLPRSACRPRARARRLARVAATTRKTWPIVVSSRSFSRTRRSVACRSPSLDFGLEGVHTGGRLCHRVPRARIGATMQRDLRSPTRARRKSTAQSPQQPNVCHVPHGIAVRIEVQAWRQSDRSTEPAQLIEADLVEFATFEPPYLATRQTDRSADIVLAQTERYPRCPDLGDDMHPQLVRVGDRAIEAAIPGRHSPSLASPACLGLPSRQGVRQGGRPARRQGVRAGVAVGRGVGSRQGCSPSGSVPSAPSSPQSIGCSSSGGRPPSKSVMTSTNSSLSRFAAGCR